MSNSGIKIGYDQGNYDDVEPCCRCCRCDPHNHTSNNGPSEAEAIESYLKSHPPPEDKKIEPVTVTSVEDPDHRNDHATPLGPFRLRGDNTCL